MSDNHLDTTHVIKHRRITSGSTELDARIKEWLIWDKNKKTLDQIKNLVRGEHFDQLRGMLMTRLKYSIEGFSGPMEAGYNAINDLFIIQCAQGILKYLEQKENQRLKTVGIVVGFDGRHSSKRFAELVTTVFNQKNYVVRMFNVVVPFYFVPFAVVKYGSAAGVMICASNGPSTINGLKIFSSSGSQVVYPMDADIENCISGSLEPNRSSWETSILNKTDMKLNPLAEVLKAYLDMILTETLNEYQQINKKSSIKFVYTALYGVGFIYMARAMNTIRLQMIPVDEEKYPTSDFASSSVPDFKGDIKLEVATQVARKTKAEYILANNPDASRVVIAEKDKNSDEYIFFNSDEIAFLLAWWCYHIYQDKVPKGTKLKNLYMVGSVFSTKLTKYMGRIDGFYYAESFGGKWLGNTMRNYVDQGKEVIFGYDEYAYVVNMNTLAIDGIQAGAQLACMTNYLCHHKIMLTDHLNDLYRQYGYYFSMKVHFTADNETVIGDIFETLRNFNGPPGYPRAMEDGKYPIMYVRDVKAGLDTAEENKICTLPSDPDVELIAFSFENGMAGSIYNHKYTPLLLTLHTSINVPGTPTPDKDELKSLLTKMAYRFIEEFVEPIKHQLSVQGMEIPGVDTTVTNKS